MLKELVIYDKKENEAVFILISLQAHVTVWLGSFFLHI